MRRGDKVAGNRKDRAVLASCIPGRPGTHMSYSLNSLKGGYIRDYIGDYYRGYEGGY